MTYARVPRLPRTQLLRERLLRRIDRSSAAAVVTGPPGFGKTTLAAQWMRARQQQGWPVVWITLDAATEPSTFWKLAGAAFAAALDSASGDRPESAVELSTLLSTPPRPVAWVIDGVSRKHPARLLDEVLTLVAHTPDLHLLMCADGPAPSILPARHALDLVVLSPNDLAFTRHETGRLLEALDVRLSDSLVGILHHEVEGWPLLVTLSATLLSEPGNAADVRKATRRAAGQLVEHYLAMLEPPVAELLLQYAVADRLTAAVAEALTGVDDARRHLERLASIGVLTKSDDFGEVTFSFATAVRSALRDWLRQTAPVGYSELLARLTDCYLEQGETQAVDALRCALRSEDVQLVTKVVEARWLTLFRADRLMLAAALQGIPPEAIAASRALTSAQSLTFDLRPPATGELRIPKDATLLTTLGKNADADEFLLYGVAMMIAVRRHVSIDRAVELVERLVIAADAARGRRDAQTLANLATVYAQAGFTCVLAGHLTRAQGLLQHAYDLRTHHRPGYAGYDAAGKLALVSSLKGDVRTATLWLNAADECERNAGRFDSWLDPYIQSARRIARASCLLEDGRLQQGATELEEGSGLVGDECGLVALGVQALHAQLAGIPRQLLDEWTVLWPTYLAHLPKTEAAAATAAASQTDLLMAAGHGTRAGAVLRACAGDSQELQVSAARWAQLTGRLDEAQYRAGCQLWESDTHRRTRVHMQLISAAVHDREGRQAEADSLLTQALALAHRNGLRSPFAAADRELLERRAGAVEGLSAMLADLDQRRLAPIFPTELKVIVLSERERAVLEALDTGLPVETVSQRLFVSTNTVKTQMKSLYAKLGTHSRADTLVRAREHGLLASRSMPAPASHGREALPSDWEGEGVYV